MAYPQYFEPDVNIPDADVLGFGHLINDDGSQGIYLHGDPEIASQFEIKPVEVPQLANGPQPGGMAPPQPIPGTNLTADLSDPQNPIKPMTGVQDPQTGELLDPGMPGTDPVSALGGFANVVRGTVGSGPLAGASPDENMAALGLGGSQQQPAPAQQQGQPGPAPPQPIPGTNLVADMFDPQQPIKPADQASQFQPYQREGALPPDVAARQQSEMGAINAQTLAAETQAREDTARIQNEATLKAMAQNEADKHKAEEDIREQQAKEQRLSDERNQLATSKIDESLIGAQGVGGALLTVLGAAMLSKVGSDSGLRNIDRIIDRHVNEQVRQKGTQLNILAEQIGNTQQAIKMGQAQLYKALGDRAELLVQKTKNDVYEAQSPAILQGIRQKQMEATQDWEQKSLGKVTERVPAPAKPPDAKMMEKYGALRRERAGNDAITQRMDQTLGLVWQPGQDGQPGSYRNKDEVLKRGIQGTGNLEQLIPDLVYSTMGGVTSEGRQVRGAAEAMAFAQLRSVQPTGPISNSDIERAVKMGALDTEDGLMLGLERMHQASETQRALDVKQYGPELVGEFERRGGGPTSMGQPAPMRPAALGDLQAEQQRRRQAQQPAEAPERGPGNMPPPTPEEFRGSVQGFAESANLNGDAILKVIGHESGGKASATNAITGKHAGLIQFSKETWQGLAKEAGEPDLTWEDMRKMSAEEQLPYVMMYYNRLGLGPDNDAGDYAMATFMPAFWQAPDDTVLGEKGSKQSIGGLSMAKVWQQNPGLRNGDRITVGDVRRSVL
jgi:hypothetical protein